MAVPQWMSGLGAAMGVGQPGIGAALGAASPLLLSMGSNLLNGQNAMANAPQALGAMMQLQEYREKKDQEKAAQEAWEQSPWGGGQMPAGLPAVMGARNGGAPPAPPPGGLPGAMTSFNPNAGPATTAPGGYALDPSKLPASPYSQMFEEAERTFGLPAGYLSRTAQIESGGDPNAQNPRSSAGGLFQFIDSTAADYGLSDKSNPGASTLAAAQLGANNAQILRRSLGREPTGAELYLAHQQGGGGAAALLSNPTARAVDVVGEAAVKNNGGDANMTAGQFADRWLSKFGGGAGAAADPMADPQVQAMIRLLAMPGLQEGQRAALQVMLQQKMKPNENVMTPYQAATLGLQEAQQNQRDPGERYKVVGGTLVDLWASGGPSPVVRDQEQQDPLSTIGKLKADLDAGRITPELFQGELARMAPQGMTIESDGAGGFRMTQGNATTVGKPLTEGQSKDNVYLTRAAGAVPDLDKYEQALTSLSDRAAEAAPFGLGRYVQSEAYQVAQNAALEFGSAILRKDTGAAMTRDEIAINNDLFIPQPGDAPAVIERKRAARARAISGIKSGMSPEQIISVERGLTNANSGTDTTTSITQPIVIDGYTVEPLQ